MRPGFGRPGSLRPASSAATGRELGSHSETGPRIGPARWTTSADLLGDADRVPLASELASGSGSVEALDQLARLAAQLLQAPSAQVLVAAEDVPTVRGGAVADPALGSDSSASQRLCELVVDVGRPVAISAAATDPRVSDLGAVRSGLVGSLLGVPLVLGGHPVGVLCVLGPDPREWTEQDAQLLGQLAVPVVAELRLAILAAEHERERQLWQLAVDAAEVGAFDWNLQTGRLRWDDRLLEIFGLTRETFEGTIDAFNAAVHADDRERVEAALAEAIATCGVYDAEYRVVVPNGTVRWVAARGRAVAGSDGRAVRVLGAAFDSTAVREGDARVSRVLEAMPSAFFHLDPEWRFTYLNNEARRLLGGIGTTEIEGGVIWELFPDAVGSEFEDQYRRAVKTGQPVAFEAYYPPPLDRWYEVGAWPTPDGLSVYFLDISERREAQRAATVALERTRRRAEITEALTGTLDIEEAAARLARAVVGDLADWSVVSLIRPHTPEAPGPRTAPAGQPWRRDLRDVAGWHAEPALRELVDRYVELRVDALKDESFLARALRQDRPVVIAQDAAAAIAEVFVPSRARDLCLQLAPASAVVVPLRGRARTVGLLTVFRGPCRGPFSSEDIDELVDAASRAGLALDNARLYAEQRDLAEALQRSLMTAPPQPEGLHVVVRYEPAAEGAQVGGDWYDAFMQPDGATSLVIGDVIGHDTTAAVQMGQIRGLLRGIAATTGEGPAQVLHRVDQAIAVLEVDTVATGIVARVERTPAGPAAAASARLRWANAGHPPPVIAIPSQAHSGGIGVSALWPNRPELLLGFRPDFQRTESAVTLPPGTTVLLYTDGLVERRDETIDVGVDRLCTVLAELLEAGVDLEDLCGHLLERMLPDQHDDDVALVAVRVES